MTLGNAIKLVRTAGRIKQGDLAKKIHSTANYLSLVENGKREPSIAFLKRLAKALGVPVGMFFLWQELGPEETVDNVTQVRDLLARLEAMYLVNRNSPSAKKRA